MQYAAPCDDDGSLTFLLFPESVTTQNILHSSAGETTYTVSEPFDGARSAVAQARAALMGVSLSLVCTVARVRRGKTRCGDRNPASCNAYRAEYHHPA